MRDLHLQKDILKIERIQKFAFHVCSKKWRANYDSLLDNFHSSTLYGRRKFLKLCTLFCIFNSSMSRPYSPISIKSSSYSCRRCHNIQMLVSHSRFSAFQHSFCVETIDSWKNLAFEASTLSSLFSFKFLLTQEYIILNVCALISMYSLLSCLMVTWYVCVVSRSWDMY